MTRLLALSIVVGVVVAWWLERLTRPAALDDDPMAQPFLDSRNSATYLYNARTGVVTSYN
mgnify:CR=1 FL=1